MTTTICIPCYEQAEWLPDALRSATSQTCSDVEVIVIDDGSPTQQAQIFGLCEDYGAHWVRVTNRGLPSARNTGLMLAEGEWFVPLDADDWIDETYVEKTVAEAEKEKADVVLTGIQEHGPVRNGCYPPGFDRPWSDVTADVMLREYNRFYYANLYRTSILKSIGGYNAKMHLGLEDYDINVDLLIRGAKFSAVEEPLFNYRTRADGMLQQIHRSGGHAMMVEEMKRHHNYKD